MKKLMRWFFPILVAVLATFMLITPILAIDDPTYLNVNSVWVYRNCRETGDQLYLVSYTINYTSPPTESAGEAYLSRLMDDTTELGAAAPYAYHDKGYGDGVVAIYFDAGEAPTWEGDYTMTLVGNPLLEWAGEPPEDSLTTFNLWQDNPTTVTKAVVSGRILSLGEELEDSWGVDMVTIAVDTGEMVLTAYGTAYFLSVVPYLTDITPYIFATPEISTDIISPDLPDRDPGTEYADSLVTLIGGTPFDLTPMADAFGVSRGALTALLYYGIVVIFAILAVRAIGSYKPIMLFSLPLVIIGAFVGVPLIVTILAGFISIGMVAYVLFYKQSTA